MEIVWKVVMWVAIGVLYLLIGFFIGRFLEFMCCEEVSPLFMEGMRSKIRKEDIKNAIFWLPMVIKALIEEIFK